MKNTTALPARRAARAGCSAQLRADRGRRRTCTFTGNVGAVHRLPLPRHLADRRAAGPPGRLRLQRTSRASTSATGTPTSTAGFFNGANLEMDFYGGYKGSCRRLRLRRRRAVLLLPGQRRRRHHQDRQHRALRRAAASGPFTLKYSHAVTDFFGIPDSKDSLLRRRHRPAIDARQRSSTLIAPRRLPERSEERRPHHRVRRQRAHVDHRLQARRHVRPAAAGSSAPATSAPTADFTGRHRLVGSTKDIGNDTVVLLGRQVRF